MSIFLSEILDHKREEISRAKASIPLSVLKDQSKNYGPTRPFVSALQNSSGFVGLIAEVKKASPSAGVIKADFHPVQIAKQYEDAGADCLSVLTDEKFFQGHLSFIHQIKKEVSLPILRKDFILDEYQIFEARAAGADAILLIVAALDHETLFRLYTTAKDIGMDVLIETHTDIEMAAAASLEPRLIGVNSRDLKSFKTTLSIIEDLAPLAPASALLVGESGIKSRADVERLKNVGVDAILVGETLMRSSSVASAVAELISL